jgi:two-component system, sensor histidine kinase and response regulator
MDDTVNILIVDDQPDNLRILYHYLNSAGYDVLIAEDGLQALECITNIVPDLILLDIMLPGLNGFEVCRRVRAMPQHCDIPIIFMTVLNGMADKLEGFQAGGVDYITKPFHHEEVLARVKTHLELHRLRRELQHKNQELDAFAHQVAHDLKNPLNAIAGYTEMLYASCDADHRQEMNEYFDQIRFITHKASEIIEALLLLSGVSAYSRPLFEVFTMDYIMPSVCRRLQNMLHIHHAELHFPSTWPSACGHPAWVEEVWVNYISNAIKYGGIPPHIELGAEVRTDCVYFWVCDNGAGLTPEQQNKLFTPFTRLHKDEHGHGLGLFIIKSIITRLGGTVSVNSTLGQGSCFGFTLPHHAPASESPEQILLEHEDVPL